ncbi:hypothetical protein TCAL_06985 [Tigriopus californicus]|uniref:Carbohydrate kinase FGGY N-terminal domain-containing protein n=3 Tax=Tigriopus californicus TaxID=6832 RepID=A0A553P8J8_TIGCA|nr:hypothetical protein TCAL_06985 [Tigriopus californicus]
MSALVENPEQSCDLKVMSNIPGHEDVVRHRKSSRNGKIILGIDIGTSSVKIALVDAQRGNLLQSGYKATKNCIGREEQVHVPGADLQDALQIIRIVRSCLSVLDSHFMKAVSHVAICGQMHGVVMWNSADVHTEQPTLSPLFTWQDQRCSSEFIEDLPRSQSHLRIATGYGCATLFWLLKHRPEYLTQFDRCGTVMDFVALKLIGGDRAQMSPQNAASWGFFNTIEEEWNHEILQNSGFPIDMLPKIVKVGSDIGTLTSSWGVIPVGVKVKAPMGDLQCSVRATFENPKTDAVVNVSTSAQISFVMDLGFTPPKVFDPDATIEYLPYESGSYLATAASLNGGNVLDSFVRTLQQWSAFLLKQDEPKGGIPNNPAGVIPKRGGFNQDQIWTKLKLAAVEQSSTELHMDPCIFGERHDADRRGSISNIGPENCYHLGSVVLAMYQGIARNLSSMCPKDKLIENGLTRIVGSGSCLIRNPGLIKAMEETFGLAVVEASSKEDLTNLELTNMAVDFNSKGNACVGAALFTMDYLKR